MVWDLISPVFCGHCGTRAGVWAISGLLHWELKGELRGHGGGDVIWSVNIGLKSWSFLTHGEKSLLAFPLSPRDSPWCLLNSYYIIMVYMAYFDAFCHLIHVNGLFILPFSTCFFVLQHSRKYLWASPEEWLQPTAKQPHGGCKWQRILGCSVISSETWTWGDQLLLKAKFNILANFAKVCWRRNPVPAPCLWLRGCWSLVDIGLVSAQRSKRAGKLLLQFQRMFPQARKIHSLSSSYISKAGPTPATTL